MKKIKLIVASITIGIGVALIYYIFESFTSGAIHLIWYEFFNTKENRLLAFVLAAVLGFIFFSAAYFLDNDSQKKKRKSIVDVPDASQENIQKILFIGFLSLVAGASLGPEGILVPACMIFGTLVGRRLVGKKESKILGGVGFAALITAFFSSILAGVLAIIFVVKQFKNKLNLELIFLTALATVSAFYVLRLIDSSSFIELSFNLSSNMLRTIPLLLIFFGLGYLLFYLMKISNTLIMSVYEKIKGFSWYVYALISSAVLGFLYVLGGDLVQFTGNDNIEPLFEQAPELGVLGVGWIILVKVVAIMWSKVAGYRGGLIFPITFLAAGMVAIFQLVFFEVNVVGSMIVIIFGALFADREDKILL